MGALINTSPEATKNWKLCAPCIEAALKARRITTTCSTSQRHYHNFVIFVSDHVKPHDIHHGDNGTIFVMQKH
jgi:hypothetical protein